MYLLFPELRGLIKVEGENGLVMLGMVVLSALRYLANACAYTAVVRVTPRRTGLDSRRPQLMRMARRLQMVLINVMTPAELVPLANGLAQSCISLARFIGVSLPARWQLGRNSAADCDASGRSASRRFGIRGFDRRPSERQSRGRLPPHCRELKDLRCTASNSH